MLLEKWNERLVFLPLQQFEILGTPVCEIEREGYGCSAFEGPRVAESITNNVALSLAEFYLTLK
jgi:hypothetical protein